MSDEKNLGRTDNLLWAASRAIELGETILVVADDPRQKEYFARAISEMSAGALDGTTIYGTTGGKAVVVDTDEVVIDPKTGRVNRRADDIFTALLPGVRVLVDHRALESLFSWVLTEWVRYEPESFKEKWELKSHTYVEDVKVVGITANTATCGAIGRSLNGISASKVSSISKRLGIEPAGQVVYDLGVGKTNKDAPARTFDLTGWTKIRDAAIRMGAIPCVRYQPPEELISPKKE